jgi:hypothetical protein
MTARARNESFFRAAREPDRRLAAIVPGRKQKFDTCSQLQYYEFLDAEAANLGPSQHEFASVKCV